MLASKYRIKLTALALASIIIFGLAELVSAQLFITEILYNVSGIDDGYEWVELYNFSDSPIELSNYSLGYGGDDYTDGKFQLSGEIQPYSCFVAGGPESEDKNANPKYDQVKDFHSDIQNATDNIADGVALFDIPAGQINTDSVPIDAVIYGQVNENNLIDETGEPGDVDVDDAPVGSSIERTLSGWQIQSSPNQGVFLPAPEPNTIPWIQGEGDVSQRVGEVVNEIGGIVTAYITSKKGFFMQDQGDFNPTTSDGIFVYKGDNGSIPYMNSGDEVLVTGKVEEHYDLTQINISDASSSVEIISSENDLPEPVELDPPAILEDSQAYFESREGMLVSASDGVVVGPTSKYGEFILVRQHVFDGRYFLDRYDGNGEKIVVDDAAEIRVELKLDDTVGGIVGVLDYNYDNYKIDATEQFQVTTADPPNPIPPIDRTNEFTIATFNLENFFDTFDDRKKSDSIRVLNDYAQKKLKLALAIKNGLHAPDIIAVQEAEKIEVLEELANHSELSGLSYVPSLIEGPDPRGIDVGFLTRSDRVKVVELRQEQAPNPIDDGRVNLFSRPPLVATLDLYRESIDVGEAHRFFLIVCHFKSMLGGEAETEPRRVEQARFVASLVDAILADDADAKVVVLGDLNSTRTTAPIIALTNGTTAGSQLKMLNSEIEIADQYSYIYEGKAQFLDYILVTDTTVELLNKVHAAHINTGFPYSHEAEDTLHRSSDHDAILASFFFESDHGDCPLPGDLSGDGEVTAYDASLILQFVVGLIDEFPVGSMTISQTIDGSITFLPARTALLQNYPNPFNPETWIPFQLSETGNNVVISIYDIGGGLVRKIRLGNLRAGIYFSQNRAAYWDGRNERCEKVGSGVYFYHLRAGSFFAIKKMVVLE